MPLLLLLINQEAITLRGEDDLNAVTAEAIMRTVRDGEREVRGRAEMQAVLEGRATHSPKAPQDFSRNMTALTYPI